MTKLVNCPLVLSENVIQPWRSGALHWRQRAKHVNQLDFTSQICQRRVDLFTKLTSICAMHNGTNHVHFHWDSLIPVDVMHTGCEISIIIVRTPLASNEVNVEKVNEMKQLTFWVTVPYKSIVDRQSWKTNLNNFSHSLSKLDTGMKHLIDVCLSAGRIVQFHFVHLDTRKKVYWIKWY